MDAVWTPIAEAVLEPGARRTDAANSSRSPARQRAELAAAPRSTAAGTATCTRTCARSSVSPSKGRTAASYCGSGNLEACRASLWAAIQAAAEQLKATQGPELEQLAGGEGADRHSRPALLPNFTMRWTNRSTFQQVIEFAGHDEG